jgi:hypothetical protein
MENVKIMREKEAILRFTKGMNNEWTKFTVKIDAENAAKIKLQQNIQHQIMSTLLADQN